MIDINLLCDIYHDFTYLYIANLKNTDSTLTEFVSRLFK